MIGIYIHIPFCVQKCNYCDFLSFPCKEEVRDRYVDALVREINNFNHKDMEVATVFFGGGTPSILSCEEIEKIMAAIKEHFCLAIDAEITMECNPGTVSRNKLNRIRELGINRLSIGLQSCSDSELRLLGRIHSYADFLDCYRMAREAGFDNINIDIMSALPGQSVESYLDTLTKVVSLKPEHVSAYSLIIEENTPFYSIYGDDISVGLDDAAGSVKGVCRSVADRCPEEGPKANDYPNLPDEEDERRMYYLTEEILGENGYHRYEISNYARDGYECRHNTTYWTGGEYAGFGLGASSYINNVRYRNEDDIDEYIYDICEKGVCKHIEEIGLTEIDNIEEFMITGLRLMRGISKSEFLSCFGNGIEYYYGDVIKELTGEGLIEEDGDRLKLTKYGIDVSNYVLSFFLFDKDYIK